MKNIFTALISLLFVSTFVYGQDAVSNLRMEKNMKLNGLNVELSQTTNDIQTFERQLESTDWRSVHQNRIETLEKLSKEQAKKIDLVEQSNVLDIKHNGAIAFAELLSVNRDMKPVSLFLAAQKFFQGLSDAGNISKYPSYESWQAEFQKWYAKKAGADAWLDAINSSINLVGDIADQVPMYGSLVQTVCSGISAVMQSVGGAGKALKKETTKVLPVMNAVSQFSNQKAIIDNEWISISKELDELKNEQNNLVESQISYYGLSRSAYDLAWDSATTYKDREKYMTKTTKEILVKIEQLNSSSDNKEWQKTVQSYMYRVQSLRVRFGQLAIRMQDNLEAYHRLINVFSDTDHFPRELTDRINRLPQLLTAVQSSFDDNFIPRKYIQDSAVMYIE